MNPQKHVTPSEVYRASEKNIEEYKKSLEEEEDELLTEEKRREEAEGRDRDIANGWKTND